MNCQTRKKNFNIVIPFYLYDFGNNSFLKKTSGLLTLTALVTKVNTSFLNCSRHHGRRGLHAANSSYNIQNQLGFSRSKLSFSFQSILYVYSRTVFTFFEDVEMVKMSSLLVTDPFQHQTPFLLHFYAFQPITILPLYNDNRAR